MYANPFPEAVGGVPISVVIEVAVMMSLFVLFGCALGCGMVIHGKRRKKRKIDKVGAVVGDESWVGCR